MTDSLLQFLQRKDWFCGPDFLSKPEQCWPKCEETLRYQLVPTDPELKKAVHTVVEVRSDNPVRKLISYYSNWLRLKRSVAWIIQVVRKLKEKVTKSKKDKVDGKKDEEKQDIDEKKKPLKENKYSVQILRDAEHVIVKQVQDEFFSKEFDILQKTDNQVRRIPRTSVLYKLDPILCDGILCVGGRIDRADIPFEERHPIILPKQSPVSHLILKEVHQDVGHMGKNAMLAKVRYKFWIIGVSTLVKQIISKCVICRKYQGRPLQQKMGDLPESRLQPDLPPFTKVGMDFFGPFQVKRGRSSVKRYGVIFTCFMSRAVHLEIAYSLDTDSCINAIRRFVARRGVVESITSDNGTNLIAAEKVLKEEVQKLNQLKIASALQVKGIQWNFNPPTGSHFGGIWERMIRLVRKVLHSIMVEQHVCLGDESIHTLFCEVEAILNGRPITESACDPKDLSPLTPNHILLMKAGESMPPGLFSKDDSYGNRRWKQVQYLADLFWKRWIREYVPLLQTRQKWIDERRNLSVNDIVLIMDKTPRNAWALGRVLSVVCDKKGHVRIARLKTASTELIRPIHKLCLVCEAD